MEFLLHLDFIKRLLPFREWLCKYVTRCELLSLETGYTGDHSDCTSQKEHSPQIPRKSEALGLLGSQEAPRSQRELGMAQLSLQKFTTMLYRQQHAYCANSHSLPGR